MYSPEVTARIAFLRTKAADGTIEQAELAEAVVLLRGERHTMTQAAAKKRSKAAKEVKSADALLNSLEGL